MPNLSVTTNADFYHNYTQRSGLSIPKILAWIIGMRSVPSSPSPRVKKRTNKKCQEIIGTQNNEVMCQTQTIFSLFIKVVSLSALFSVDVIISHITLPPHSLCLFPSILKSLDVVPYSWITCSPGLHHPRLSQLARYKDILTSLTRSDQNLFQEFSTKQDRYGGRRRDAASAGFQDSNRQQFSKNWKTGNCLVTTMKSHWILESWEKIESNLTIKPTMSEEEEEWM